VDMKKLLVLFVALGMLVAALPLMAISIAAQGLDVAGEFWIFGNYDFTDPATATSMVSKAEMNFVYKMDDFNTVKLELDSEGAAWTAGPNVQIDDFRIISDLGGAFKLPVKITATFGYFDTYFTDWSYVSMSGWEFYYDWPNLLATDGPDSDFAWQLDVGVGPVTLHWWNDYLFERMMLGVSGGFGPVTGWITFQDTFAEGIGEGILGLEAKYAGKFGDLGLTVPAFFRYNLDSSAFTWGAGVGVDYSIVHFAAGIEGDDVDALDNMVFDVSVAPMEGFKAAVSAYFNLNSANAFTGLAIELRKSVGALTAVLGYVVGGEDGTAIPLYDDNPAYANGLYCGVAISY